MSVDSAAVKELERNEWPVPVRTSQTVISQNKQFFALVLLSVKYAFVASTQALLLKGH